MTKPPPNRFDAATALRFAAVALENIGRAYPHKLDHVIDGDADIVAPRELHPAFHGSFDWHSCVHMHWLLARIRREFPQLPACAAIDSVFDRHLSADAVAAEVAYLNRPSSASFERPYGWAWLLKLAAELHRGDVTGVDRNDPQLVHLDGLNLSRAWCLFEIAAGLAPDDSRADVARRAGDAHLAAGWHGLASDDFVGAHWLATFAALALDAAC